MSILFTSATATAQTVIPLYEVVPNSKVAADREKSETGNGGIQLISHVSKPTLTMYGEAPKGKKATAVIICPGGGYGVLAASHEGSDVARTFNRWGIVAFVLKYRLPDDELMIDRSIGPLQDAQRAIQIVRKNAAKWNIDTSHIGIMGFSAGGHLASTASTHFNQPVIDNPEQVSLRPDFSILIYPVISFTDSLGHEGSRNNLIGKNAEPARIIAYSNELQVTANTPPAFLEHSIDDETVKYQNSQRYYDALRQFNIPAELRLYEKGGHGYGMHNNTTNDQWMDRLQQWMRSMHYL